jgi:putative transposase
MANTFTQLYIQFVFAPKFRDALISPQWDERLRKYISGIVTKNGHKLLAINNMPDHVHLFIGLAPQQALSEIMRLVKGDSSEWINKNKLCPLKFQWQEGYGAFSYSRSHIDKVIQYIANQQEHHKKISFLDEYKDMLNKFDITYDPQYIFKPPA